MFKKATKKQSKLRLALAGTSGAGKTYSALSIASHLGSSIAVIDTEKGSASKYSDIFDFDVCDLSEYHPTQYIKAIRAADTAGYDVIIIDSLTHAWYAELELAGGNFNNWSKVKPLERALIDAMLSSKAHIIATMRSKTEYTMQEGTGRNGQKTAVPVKVGMAPIQASGIEYEFDVAGDLSLEHVLSITKTRCPDLDNTTHLFPGKELAQRLLAWLGSGSPQPEFAPPTQEAPTVTAPAPAKVAPIKADNLKSRIEEIMAATGHSEMQMTNIASKNQVLPEQMNLEQYLNLRDMLLADYSMKFNVFKTKKDAWNTYKAEVLNFEQYNDDSAVITHWQSIIEARKAETSEAVEEGVA